MTENNRSEKIKDTFTPTNQNIYNMVKEILDTQRNEWKRREEIEFKISELQKQMARIEEMLAQQTKQKQD